MALFWGFPTDSLAVIGEAAVNMNWESNPEYRSLPPPKNGGIIHLKFQRAFAYRVKCIVVSVSNDTVEATVDAVFDWNGGGQLTGGEAAQLVGKIMTLRPEFLHEVINRP